MSLLIADSFTLSGKIDARGPWPTVEFRYRPALPESVYEYFSNSRADGKIRMKAMVKILGDGLQSWDVKDEKGESW